MPQEWTVLWSNVVALCMGVVGVNSFSTPDMMDSVSTYPYGCHRLMTLNTYVCQVFFMLVFVYLNRESEHLVF